jgi:hypothetical protein
MSWARQARIIAATASRVVGNDITIDETTSGKGILSMPKEEVLNGMVVSSGYRLEYPFNVFGVVEEGTEVIVDEINYTATEDAMPTGDGAMYIVPLKKED